MLTKKRVKVHVFQADQLGIDQLKNEFFSKARDFVYFRKGEWHGIEESIGHAAQWVQTHPQWVATAVALYVPAQDLVQRITKATHARTDVVNSYFGDRGDKTDLVTVRVIVRKGSVSLSQVSEWEDICGKGSVVTIPKAQTGPFRYLVNERRYAIFSRMSPNNLRGLIGTDEQIISLLRTSFDEEFVKAAIQNQKSKKKATIR